MTGLLWTDDSKLLWARKEDLWNSPKDQDKGVYWIKNGVTNERDKAKEVHDDNMIDVSWLRSCTSSHRRLQLSLHGIKNVARAYALLMS